MSYEEHSERVARRRAQLEETLRERLLGWNRIDLEIGSGHGHWLTGYAQSKPDLRCLGIDIVGDRVLRAGRKASRAGLSNLAFERAEAMETLDLLPERIEIDRVFILFPDPWPKKRHWKYRLLNEQFLDALAARCRPAAGLYFRTDSPGYLDWGQKALQNHPAWRIEPNGVWPFELETVFQAKAGSWGSVVACHQPAPVGRGRQM